MRGWGAVIYRALTLSRQRDQRGWLWLSVCVPGELEVCSPSLHAHKHMHMVWATCPETQKWEHTDTLTHTHTQFLWCGGAGKLLLLQFPPCRFTWSTAGWRACIALLQILNIRFKSCTVGQNFIVFLFQSRPNGGFKNIDKTFLNWKIALNDTYSNNTSFSKINICFFFNAAF